MQKKKIDIFDYIFLNISSGPDEANSHEGNISKRLIFLAFQAYLLFNIISPQSEIIARKTKMLKFKPKLFSNNVLYLFLPCLSWFFGLLPTNFGNAAHPLLKTFSLTFRVSNYFTKWCRKTQANSLIFS